MKGYTMTQLIVHDSQGAHRYLFANTKEALENLDMILDDENEEPNLRVEIRRLEVVREDTANRGTLRLE